MKEYRYSVEMWDVSKKEWRKDIRTYYKKQNIKDFPDNNLRRNFKEL